MSNIFTCVGTIVRDAEVRHTPSGQSILNVTVANNQGFGDKQKTLFIRCAVWGKRAESKLSEYLLKGQQVLVSGELTQNEYEKDGVVKTSLELNCNVVDLVGSKKEHSGQQQAPNTQDQSNQHADYFENDVPFNSLNSMIKNHLL